jgi:hypothetical protein
MAADLTHGPSWLTATQQDDGEIELARKSWRRFGKWPRRILMISKPSGKLSECPTTLVERLRSTLRR